MIQYILECIAFQLAFLVIYDFFLKKETFFQWNRVYLIGTYVLSLVLPWIKIEALKTSVSEQYAVYPEFLWNMNSVGVTAVGKASPFFQISWPETVLYIGMFLAALYFGYKLNKLKKLREEGIVERFPNFTRIVIKNSELAFSFFRSIFLGDKIFDREHSSILKHELVHIEQRHSLDLVFFELMRIVGWFNPLVYVYQNRIAELHEFIADAQVPKAERKAHYDLLLSQIFQTQHISFVNQFYKSSLIKKRIVMLQKSKSKKVFQLKYLLLLPMVFGMLAYTSSSVDTDKSTPITEIETVDNLQQINSVSIIDAIPFAEVEKVPVFPGCENDADKRGCFFENMRKHIRKHFNYPKEAQEKGIQGRVNTMFVIDEVGNIINAKYRGPDSLLTNEAERIISRLPQMQPGEHKGSKVQVAFSIPISFKLNSNEPTKERTSQSYDEASSVPFGVIDEIPIFPGCENATDKRACFNQMMQKHISKNFLYPKAAQDAGIQGRVNTIFTIGADGNVKNLKMRGPDALLENETGRIIDLLPKMEPGEHKGKKVDVPYSIPISFVLDTDDSSSESGIRVRSTDMDMGVSLNEKPMYILNGVQTSLKIINTINPDDIASINVLKDKAAIDKYGKKAKDGVIEITLKKKD